MTEEPTRRVLAVFADAGLTARFVGGAVRDAVLGRTVLDIDIATPVPPSEVMALMNKAGIKVVPTGIDHGTVTAVVRPRHFEITTLRRDVETMGRRALVAFTEDWAKDAERRDFTMNALFLDPDGTIHDPVGGLADLRAGRVRFVGDPETRIREDVLRLLRFYRFFAHYGRGMADAAARAACRALVPLLPTLSAERVAAELLKLLAAPDPLPALRLMAEDGVLAAVMPEARRQDRLAGLVTVESEASVEIDPVRRLAALTDGDRASAIAMAERLRLSTVQRERLAALAEPPWPVELDAGTPAQRRAYYHLGAALYRDLVLLRAAERRDAARARVLLAEALSWGKLEFPLRGRDVKALGLAAGPAIGKLLGQVEAWWEAGDFQASRIQCLDYLKTCAGRSHK